MIPPYPLHWAAGLKTPTPLLFLVLVGIIRTVPSVSEHAKFLQVAIYRPTPTFNRKDNMAESHWEGPGAKKRVIIIGSGTTLTPLLSVVHSAYLQPGCTGLAIGQGLKKVSI